LPAAGNVVGMAEYIEYVFTYINMASYEFIIMRAYICDCPCDPQCCRLEGSAVRCCRQCCQQSNLIKKTNFLVLLKYLIASEQAVSHLYWVGQQLLRSFSFLIQLAEGQDERRITTSAQGSAQELLWNGRCGLFIQ
jgi:hypothetical protein